MIANLYEAIRKAVAARTYRDAQLSRKEREAQEKGHHLPEPGPARPEQEG